MERPDICSPGFDSNHVAESCGDPSYGARTMRCREWDPALVVAVRPRRQESLSATFGRMGCRSTKKPLALLGALGTMAAVWWFALRPRFRNRP
jgi:hypothetical protein